MGKYTSELVWERGEQDFLGNRYSRRHLLRFDGGAEVLASSSPQILPPPMSDESAVDPEEAFVASLSSCHMLWFLSLAARDGFCVDRYHDSAMGVMAKNTQGRMAMTKVTLQPNVDFSGENLPTQKDILNLHEEAHEKCFIANSVRSDVQCEPVFSAS